MRLRVPTLVVAATLALSACGSSGSSSTSSPSASDSATGSITVFAAASLKESFTTIGTQFEAAHPGSKVTFNFGATCAIGETPEYRFWVLYPGGGWTIVQDYSTATSFASNSSPAGHAPATSLAATCTSCSVTVG